MKLSFAAFSLAVLPTATLAFTAAPKKNGAISRSTLFAATLDSPPAKDAPGSGWEPEWENREGLAPEQFMKSDVTKPDISGMWECPLTRWDSEG
jgi:hypothetical protein